MSAAAGVAAVMRPAGGATGRLGRLVAAAAREKSCRKGRDGEQRQSGPGELPGQRIPQFCTGGASGKAPRDEYFGYPNSIRRELIGDGSAALKKGGSALDQAAVKRLLDLLPDLLREVEDERTVLA